MKTDQGIVMTRQGSTVSVMLQPQQGCVSCSLSRLCTENRRHENPSVLATASADIVPGDLVEVTIDDSLILKVSAIMYGIPLLAFLAGIFGGYGFSSLTGLQGDLATAVPVASGFVLLVLGIIVSHAMTLKLNVTGNVIRKIDKEAEKRR